nr:MAG TPA: hypothetical protein [Caudoviricetes sp.]
MMFTVIKPFSIENHEVGEGKDVSLRMSSNDLKVYDDYGVLIGEAGRVTDFIVHAKPGDDTATLCLHLAADESIVVRGRLDACIWLIKHTRKEKQC